MWRNWDRRCKGPSEKKFINAKSDIHMDIQINTRELTSITNHLNFLIFLQLKVILKTKLYQSEEWPKTLNLRLKDGLAIKPNYFNF